MKNKITRFVLFLIALLVVTTEYSFAQTFMGGDSGGVVAFTANGPVIDNIAPSVSKKDMKKKIKDKDKNKDENEENPDNEVTENITSENLSGEDNIKKSETIEVEDGVKEITTFESGAVKEDIAYNDGSTMTTNISADQKNRSSVYKKGNYTTEIETVIESSKKETKIISTAITTDANGKLIAETTKEKILSE